MRTILPLALSLACLTTLAAPVDPAAVAKADAIVADAEATAPQKLRALFELRTACKAVRDETGMADAARRMLEICREAYRAMRQMPDADWLKGGDLWLLMDAAASSQEGIPLALEIADRIAALENGVPGAIDAKRRLRHTAVAYAKRSQDDALRAKAAAYLQIARNVAVSPAERASAGIERAEALFRVNHDLGAARRMIAEVLADPALPAPQRETAELWRDMLAD